MTRHLGAGSAHGHRMGALKTWALWTTRTRTRTSHNQRDRRDLRAAQLGPGTSDRHDARRIGRVHGSDIHSQSGAGAVIGAGVSMCPCQGDFHKALGDHGLRLREDRRQSPLPTSRCGMTTCWHHLLSLLVSRETRRCHWTLPRGADSNVGPLPESAGSGSVNSGNQFQNRP